MIHAVSMLLDEKAQLSRKLGPVEALQASYALAEEAADELGLACGDNRLWAHRMLIRAHFVEYLNIVGEDARELLRDLLSETASQPSVDLT